MFLSDYNNHFFLLVKKPMQRKPKKDNCKLLLFGHHHDKEYGREKITTHVVRLKLFRLKGAPMLCLWLRRARESMIAVLWRNMILA